MTNWFGTDGRQISATEAGELLGNVLDRQVAYTTIFTTNGEVTVSTVFLVIDHSFGGRGGPILWETLVGGGPLDQDMDRYSSLEDAAEGHKQALTLIRAALDVAGTEILIEDTITGPCWPKP